MLWHSDMLWCGTTSHRMSRKMGERRAEVEEKFGKIRRLLSFNLLWIFLKSQVICHPSQNISRNHIRDHQDCSSKRSNCTLNSFIDPFEYFGLIFIEGTGARLGKLGREGVPQDSLFRKSHCDTPWKEGEATTPEGNQISSSREGLFTIPCPPVTTADSATRHSQQI